MSTRLLTLYLRREPTVDAVWLRYGDGRRKWDVRYYRDRQAQYPRATCPWHYRGKPRRGCRTTRLNCWRWRVVWLPDFVPAGNRKDGRTA
jgi:hypothetical protein